jgi:hypothetical protein
MKQVALGLVCLALSTVAHAGNISVDLTLDGNFYTDYSFYSYTSTTGQAEDNIPVAPYITYLNGSGYDNSVAYTFCFDFNSPTDVGVEYPGVLETPTDSATMEATYLINQMLLDGGMNAPLATRGAISTAIWEIMNPSSTTASAQFPTDPAALPYEAAAATAVTSGAWTTADSARYPTWVPEDPTLQRFGVILVSDVPTSVPEPTSLGMVGFAILSLVFLYRKHRIDSDK